jgi:DnaJ like chaperone protein
MAIGKWIGGIVGWMTGGMFGAVAGVVLGHMFDKGLDSVSDESNSGERSFSDVYGNQGHRNNFLFALLVLMAYIIRADGKVMHSEMEFARNFLRNNFGEGAVAQGEQILIKLFNEQKRQGTANFRNTVRQCCQQIAMNMQYAERLQLLSFLSAISKADGRVTNDEVLAIRECAQWMQISKSDVESMFNLGGNTLEEAYKVLGVSPDATDDEVRKAYRKLALQHHPDRVATLGEDIRRAAEQKLQKINEAKERIYKERGM